ncbi:MAG TPA: aldo/keto reductase [Verrucomicrobiae bacterium]|nr:aldo/keto reductase [Verrucomicrobiae bacterium]
MKRRTFLKTVGGAAGAAALVGPNIFAAEETEERVQGMPRRVLGRTGRKVSVVCFPGLSLFHCDQEKGTAALHNAFERGVNYFDVAPNYGNGDAEIKMGIGLQGIERSDYFLACKTHKRDKAGAQMELDRSLQRLKADHFDLYQLHHLVRPSEVKQVFGPDGAMEPILKAREQGKVRHIGFSAHTTKAALEAMKTFQFDTVMFPINFVEYYNRDFGKEILALANEQGAGVIAIKPLSWGTWPKGAKRNREWWYSSVEEPPQVELAVRFSLSQKGVAAAVPTSFVELLDKTIEAAKAYTPLDAAGTAQLQQMAQNRESIFLAEEKQVALNLPHWTPVYPGSPHECC